MKQLKLGNLIKPSELIEKVDSTEKPPMLWRGVKKGSLGFVFGPGKSGKTIFCENFAYHLAARKEKFLDSEMDVSDDDKVFLISLEEPNILKRGNRNKVALQNFSGNELEKINNNLVIADDYTPYIWTTHLWNDMLADIKETDANIIFIDSLTHLYKGEIENSTFAQNLTRRIREAVDDLGITLIIIHHTPKLNGEPITIDSLAGSRILAQEAEFLIGVNKGLNNTRYIKDVAYRYQREKDQVLTFDISDKFSIEPKKEIYENQILREFDGRTDSKNRNQILSYIIQESENAEEELVKTSDIKEAFPDLGHTTVHESLSKLMTEQKIDRPKKGFYKPE